MIRTNNNLRLRAGARIPGTAWKAPSRLARKKIFDHPAGMAVSVIWRERKSAPPPVFLLYVFLLLTPSSCESHGQREEIEVFSFMGEEFIVHGDVSTLGFEVVPTIPIWK